MSLFIMIEHCSVFPLFVLTKVFSSFRSHCRNWVGTELLSHRWPTKPTTVLEPAPFPCQKSVIVGIIIIISIIIVIVNIVKVVNGSSIVYHCNYFPPSSCFHWSFCQWTGHIFSNIASYTQYNLILPLKQSKLCFPQNIQSVLIISFLRELLSKNAKHLQKYYLLCKNVKFCKSWSVVYYI